MTSDSAKKDKRHGQQVLGPETATRALAVSLGRKILSDVVLVFSALTIIGVLRVIYNSTENHFVKAIEIGINAVLAMWIAALIVSVFPARSYERAMTPKNRSFREIAIGVVVVTIGMCIMLGTTRFIDASVEALRLAAAR